MLRCARNKSAINKHQLSNNSASDGPVPQYCCQLASWEAHSAAAIPRMALLKKATIHLVLVGPAGSFLVIHS
jgi:hypothetical protein